MEYIESVIPPVADEKAQTNHCGNPEMLTSANEPATENNKGNAEKRVHKIIGEVPSHLTELYTKACENLTQPEQDQVKETLQAHSGTFS